MVEGAEACRSQPHQIRRGSIREKFSEAASSEIAVPLGDKQARLQLESPTPDMHLVTQGFVQGRNNPEDVANMSMLFNRFGRVRYMERAIAVWTEGDREIDQLRQLADQLFMRKSTPRTRTRQELSRLPIKS